MVTHDIVEVTPQRAQELVEAGCFVLDIRPDADWAAGHIPGSTHLPVSEVVSGLGTRVPEPTLVVSTAGRGRMAQYLRNQGIEVSNLVGGFFAWEAAGLPVER